MGVGEHPQGFLRPFQCGGDSAGCRGGDGVSAVELWTTLYESLQENHCLTSPSPPPPGVETTFPGTIAPGLRLAAEGPRAHQLWWESPCGAVLVPGGWAHEHQPDPPLPPPPWSGLQEQGSQQHASEARAHYPPVLG